MNIECLFDIISSLVVPFEVFTLDQSLLSDVIVVEEVPTRE